MTSNHIFNYDQGLTLREKKSRFSLLSKIEKKNLKKMPFKSREDFSRVEIYLGIGITTVSVCISIAINPKIKKR